VRQWANGAVRQWVVTLACACSTGLVAFQQQPPAALLDPAALTATAPETYRALLDTSVGIIVIRVTRAWAPLGADRFYNLVKHGFYDEARFFRVVPKFMAQFGLHGNPAVSAVWKDANLPSDRPRESNIRGKVTFAQGRLASTRTTQVFINFADNSRLDIEGFAPFGEVTSSMILAERLYSDYGEAPDQGRIILEGNAFLTAYFPRLSYIRKATIE
jgi:peptidyl-prolyl cis-trans isomerase A (cyclophilin A)